MDFDIYVVGGGEKMVDFLNGVAMYSNAHGIATTAGIGMTVGLMWTMANVALQYAKFEQLIKYVVGTMIFVSVVINTTVDTYVTDPINPTYTRYKVSNVPLGLAYLTSQTTKLDLAITHGAEMVFSAADDLKYSQTGMLMGQEMLIEASRVTINDSSMKENFASFVQNCVLFDVQLGKYTMNDVLSANDLWDFFKNYSNTESRAFQYDGEFVTCKDGVTKLDAKWTSIVNDQLGSLANRLFPQYGETNAKAKLVSLLPVSYETIVGVSSSAADLVKQNMMINVFYQSVNGYNMATSNDAASQAYIDARATLQTVNTKLITGRQNGKWLVYMKTVFLLILVALFIIMAPFATLPGHFKKFVSGYAGLFFMVSLWGPIYAIINYMMLSDSISETQGLTQGALTAYTQGGIKAINAGIAATAADFFGYVPYIAIALTGLGAGFSSMIQSGLSSASRAAAAVANDVTTGNISLGNTTQGVHAFNNMNSNSFENGVSYTGSGQFTRITSTGARNSLSADGTETIDTSGANSKINTAGLVSKQSLGQSLSKEGAEMISTNTSKAKEYSAARSSNMSGGIQNSMNRFNHRSESGSWGYSDSSQQSESAKYLQSKAKKFADTFNVSEAAATQYMAQAYADGSWDTSKSLAGSIAGFASGLSAKVGLRGHVQGSKTDTDTTVKQWVKDNLNSEEFANSMNSLFNASKDQRITENNGEGIDNRTTYGAVENYTRTGLETARANIDLGKSYKQAGTEIANNQFELTQDYSQKFVDYLKGQGKTLSDIDRMSKAENMDEMRDYANQFKKQEAGSLFNEWNKAHQRQPITQESVYQTYGENRANIPTLDNQGKLERLKNETESAENMSVNQSADTTKSKVETALKGQQEYLDPNSQQPVEIPSRPDQRAPYKPSEQSADMSTGYPIWNAPQPKTETLTPEPKEREPFNLRESFTANEAPKNRTSSDEGLVGFTRQTLAGLSTVGVASQVGMGTVLAPEQETQIQTQQPVPDNASQATTHNMSIDSLTGDQSRKLDNLEAEMYSRNAPSSEFDVFNGLNSEPKLQQPSDIPADTPLISPNEIKGS